MSKLRVNSPFCLCAVCRLIVRHSGKKEQRNNHLLNTKTKNILPSQKTLGLEGDFNKLGSTALRRTELLWLRQVLALVFCTFCHKISQWQIYKTRRNF